MGLQLVSEWPRNVLHTRSKKRRPSSAEYPLERSNGLFLTAHCLPCASVAVCLCLRKVCGTTSLHRPKLRIICLARSQ
jgi:hypothetical protein